MRGALVATLGSQPQVVFLALQLLVRRGERIEHCLVLHTRSQNRAIQKAVESVKKSWPLVGRNVELVLCPLPLEDIDSDEALRRSYRTVRMAIQNLKQEGFVLHLCVSGGRKPLAIIAFLIAQFLFGPGDKLWYLYSPPEFERCEWNKALPPSHVRLIEIPVPVWTELPLFLAAVRRYDDPWMAAEAQRALVRDAEKRRLQEFFSHRLTQAEREVLTTLVLHGGSNKDLAQRLGKSARTVGHQLSAIYRKLRVELGTEIHMDRTSLVSLFAPILRL